MLNVLFHMEMVGFKVGLIFEIWIMIQGCVRMVLVVLKVPCEDLEWIHNCKQKLFARMRHGGFIFGSSIVEFLSEFLHLEEHCFGCIVYSSN